MVTYFFTLGLCIIKYREVIAGALLLHYSEGKKYKVQGRGVKHPEHKTNTNIYSCLSESTPEEHALPLCRMGRSQSLTEQCNVITNHVYQRPRCQVLILKNSTVSLLP